MDYKVFLRKVYYVNYREFILNLIITLITISILKLASFFKIEVIQDFLELIYIITIMLLNMLTIHLKIITKKKIYGIINIFLFIIGIVNIIGFTPVNYFVSLKSLSNSIHISEYKQFQCINLIIIYYLLFKYKSKNNNKIYIEYFVGLIFSTILLFYNNIKIVRYINFIIVILLLILIYIFKIDDDININKKRNNIDIINLNLYIIIIKYLLNSFEVIVNKYLIYDITSIFINIIIGSNLLIITKNVIRENYNFIFKETSENNKHLEMLNKNLIKNNNELEKKYEILKKRKIIYQNFLKSLPEPIVILNENCRVMYSNIKFLKLISKDNIKEISNKKINDYIDIDLKDFNLLKLRENNIWVQNIELNNKTLEVRIFNVNNEFKEFICLFKDITFDVQLNNKKKKLEEIKIKEKLKNNFLSNISHDLKIPVNVIYSATQLEKILINNNDIKKILSYNKMIKENCFLLTKLTNNLIDMSKIDSETLEKKLVNENIVEFIEEYINSIISYVKNDGVELIFDTSEEEILINFDKEMMQRILLNLISNSLKFKSSNGKINIYIKDYENFIKIYFSDNGIGVSEEFQKKIFEKYEMEERSKKVNKIGFGIGLFVVYNLVKAQNGNIEVKSKINKGTTFIITMFK